MRESFTEELKSPNLEDNFYLLSQEPQTTVVHNATDGIKVSEWPPGLPCFLTQQEINRLESLGSESSVDIACRVFVGPSIEAIMGVLVTPFCETTKLTDSGPRPYSQIDPL